MRLLRIVPTHPGDAVAAIDPDDIEDFRDVLRHPDWWDLMTAFLKYIGSASETPSHRLAWLAAQIGRRFGAVPDGVRKRIDAASLEQLEAWSDRVLDAATLDDVFG